VTGESDPVESNPAASKSATRGAALSRRRMAFDAAMAAGHPAPAAYLSAVLAGYRGAPVAGYLAIRTEIDPAPVMAEAAAHGLVGVPVIRKAGQPLVFAQWEPETPLIDGPFGARIPAVERLMVPQVVIVPLVAFDRRGGRLGYGGGFYDRTLQALRAQGPVLAIGFAWALQEDDALPLEPTDQPLNLIVTEQGVIEV
jgi:5-formyltetrahydrofolate cyclo-ligase